MADLHDANRAARERRLLSTVPFDGHACLGIFQKVRRDGWVVRHLLRHKGGFPQFALRRPVAVEQLAQHGVQRLLLRAHARVARRVLALQRTDEPAQNSNHALLRRRTILHIDERRWVLAPVRRVLGQ